MLAGLPVPVLDVSGLIVAAVGVVLNRRRSGEA
jgi:hypothetical protein